MTDFLKFAMMRELSNDYYQQRISKEEYRKLRKNLLDIIDKEVNYIEPDDHGLEPEQGFVDKLMSYFKNSDEEKIL